MLVLAVVVVVGWFLIMGDRPTATVAAQPDTPAKLAAPEPEAPGGATAVKGDVVAQPASAMPDVPAPAKPLAVADNKASLVTFSQRLGPKEQEDALKSALTLCSKAAFPSSNVPSGMISYGQDEADKRPLSEFGAMSEHAGRELITRGPDGSFDLGDAFPRSAQALASAAPRATYYLRFSGQAKPVPFEPVRKLLGQEDSTLPGGLPESATTKLPVNWRFYGWCGFGVDPADKVIALKARCKDVKLVPDGAPPVMIAAPKKEEPSRLLRHTGPIAGAEFASGGAELITWERDGIIRVWNVETGETKARFVIGGKKGDKLGAPLEKVAVLGPTRWLLLTGGRLEAWDFAKDTRSPVLPADAGAVMDWHISGRESGLVLTRDKAIYDLKNRTRLRTLGKREPPAGKIDPNLGTQPRPGYRFEPVGGISPDGRRVLWANLDKMWLYDVTSGKELHIFEDTAFVNSLVFAANGKRALTVGVGSTGAPFGIAGVVGQADDKLRLWDLDAKRMLPPPSIARGSPRPGSRAAALNADGTQVLLCTERSDEREPAQWNTLSIGNMAMGTSRTLDESYLAPKASITEGFNLGGGTAPAPSRRTIDAALFAPDGRHAISYGSGTEISVWKLTDAPATAELLPVTDKPAAPKLGQPDDTKKPVADPAGIQARLDKGGPHWKSFTRTETFPGKMENEGTKFWCWPEHDDPITVKRSAPKLTLAWSVRPGQPPLAASDVEKMRLDFFVSTPGQFHGFGGQIEGWRPGDTKGTLQITPGPKIAEFNGEGEFTIFLNARGTAVANILKVKIKIVD